MSCIVKRDIEMQVDREMFAGMDRTLQTCKRGSRDPSEERLKMCVAERLQDEISDLEHELADEREKWNKLKAKVEQALKHSKGVSDRLQYELHELTGWLAEASLRGCEELTAKVMLKNDETRKAYAIYDAIRSVQIWMDGYL